MAIVANLNKEIWEGRTVADFIEELKPPFEQMIEGDSLTHDMKTRDAVKRWCIDNQPNYKKYIKEVVDYFWKCFEFGRLL